MFTSLCNLDNYTNMRALRGVLTYPIAHALRLPETTKKSEYEGCVPPLRSGPLAVLRFGSTCMERKRRKNYTKFSGHYVHPRTQNVHAHTLCSHKYLISLVRYFLALHDSLSEFSYQISLCTCACFFRTLCIHFV